jgi:hypothetical protein
MTELLAWGRLEGSFAVTFAFGKEPTFGTRENDQINNVTTALYIIHHRVLPDRMTGLANFLCWI